MQTSNMSTTAMKRRKISADVISHSQIAPDIWDLRLKTFEVTSVAGPGQFVMVYPKNAATLLPRPISICTFDDKTGTLRLVYRVAGKGTKEFSSYKEGDAVDILGPIGNGFSIDEAKGKKVLLLGGGIGIPPMLGLARAMSEKGETAKIDICVGFRDSNLFLKEDFGDLGELHIATEDGSIGTKGNVMDAIEADAIEADIIYACGPMPMLRVIKAYAAGKGIEAYISLEERMACGVGACLGCVCKTVEKDAHSHVNNARICTEGPVFEAKKVEI